MTAKFTYRDNRVLGAGAMVLGGGFMLPFLLNLFGLHIAVCFVIGAVFFVSGAYLGYRLIEVKCEYSADERQAVFRVNGAETVIPYDKITDIQFFVRERTSFIDRMNQNRPYPEECIRFVCNEGVYEFKNALPRAANGVVPTDHSKFAPLREFILSRRA